MKVFVVFGSASDNTVSQPLVESLKRVCDDVEFQVISAHRNIDQLQEKIKNWQGDAVIAGAGLAAALPGVVAALTKLPVFGVPVNSQFGGLDSLASIAQMPPGVPVLACGPDRTGAIVGFLDQWQAAQPTSYVHFVVPEGLKAGDIVEKSRIAAQDKGLTVTSSNTPDDAAFNVYLVAGAEDIRPQAFGLHVPFFKKEAAADAKNYLTVLDWAKHGGLWVGANNTRNAVAAAARLYEQRKAEGKKNAA
ncbi:MAG: AIR carboxylase family protein [Alphaproteobacteria bacterium]|nr:AIR carboxylase family protein [Alphaproteobacteria bacterium]MDE2337428.1 AIR carboxylase family protein [Alphaproteobacteria bacterium]